MNFLGNCTEAYYKLQDALYDIEDYARISGSKNYDYFIMEKQSDKDLSDYVNSVLELKKYVSKFSNLFDELLMEIEVAEEERWREEQTQIEEYYYSEGINGTFQE